MQQYTFIKDVRSQGGGRFDQYGHLRTRGEGVLQIQMSALFDAKTCGLFEIYGVSALTKGEEG